MSKLRKIFITGIMMMTVLSLSVVVAPSTNAAASAGDLIKISSSSAVYYLGANAKRYVFPNEATYFSWYKDFSGVVTIPQSEMETYPLAANVTIRPGTKLIKSPSISTVYAVEANGTLHSIVSEANAINLWGANWSKNVVDVIDSFFTNYTVGSAMTVGKYPAGQLIKTAGSPDVYVIASDGSARKFATEAAFLANGYNFNNVVTAPTGYTMPSMGAAVNGVETTLADVSQGGGMGNGTVAGTGLSIALASDTPAAASVPQTAPADFLKFNITASNDGAVVVNSIKLTAGGLGDATAIDSVTLYSDGVRVGTSKNIDSNKEANFNFSNGITVPAGQTKSILVRAQIASGDTNQHTLGIAKAADITATGSTVSGSFPVTGNIMSGVSVSVGQLTVAAGNSLSNPKLGDKGANIASVKLTNGNIENINLTSLTLKRSDGTASDDDFENIGLYVSGTKVATSAGFKDKFVTFTFDTPYLIEKNKDKKFDVKADVVDGAAKTVTVSLDSTSDVVAMGVSYGTNARITGSYAGTSLTIAAGDVALAKTNAVNEKVRKDSANVEFGTIKITPNSGKDVEMSTLKLTITSTGTQEPTSAEFTGIETVEVMDKSTGNVYDLTYVSGSSATVKVYSNTSMDLLLTSGVTKELVVRADTTTNASTSATYTVSIASVSGGDLVIKENGSNTTISDITPSSLTLNPITILAPAVTFTTNPLGNSTVVSGSSNVTVLSFNMKANETSVIKVTEIIIAEEVSNNNLNSMISQYRLYKDGDATPIKAISGSKVSTADAGEVTFDGLAINVPKGESVKYYVTVDFNTGEASSTKWGLHDATAEDDEQENVVETLTDGVDSGNTVTTVGTGSLYVEMDTTDSAADRDAYAIAGKETGILAAIKMKAANEDVKIEDLAISATNITGNAYTDVNKVYESFTLLDSDKTTVLKTINSITATTTIEDINLVVPKGYKTIYLKGKLNLIGESPKIGMTGASSTFAVSEIVAKGVSSNGAAFSEATTTSGAACTAGYVCYVQSGTNDYLRTLESKETAVLASKISSVALVSAGDNGCALSSSLTAGLNTVAIIKITTDSNDNTLSDGSALNTILDTVKVNVTGATTTYISLKKCGGVNSAVTDEGAAATGTLSLAAATTDRKIGKGTTVYYEVKAYVADMLSGVANDWIQVDLNYLNGNSTTGNFTWYDSTDAKVKYPLRLTATELTGTKINEN